MYVYIYMCVYVFIFSILVYSYTVQLIGNVARRHSQVPQRSPPRDPNADIPRTRPESNCVDKHQPRE